MKGSNHLPKDGGVVLPACALALALLAGVTYHLVGHSGEQEPEPDAQVRLESPVVKPSDSMFSWMDWRSRDRRTPAVDHPPLMSFAGNPLLLSSSARSPYGFSGLSSNLHDLARRYQPYVERHSERFEVCRNLIYAIIKVESNFDRLAASPSSALGLMQLVPETGARDAYRMVYGSDETPSPDYLYDPDKNIELGTAYLKLLARDFFAGVENPVSREYCQIAAYNTGAGNVLKAFGSSIPEALETINSLSSREVFEHLVANLPREESRNYLPKVLTYQREFASL